MTSIPPCQSTDQPEPEPSGEVCEVAQQLRGLAVSSTPPPAKMKTPTEPTLSPGDPRERHCRRRQLERAVDNNCLKAVLSTGTKRDQGASWQYGDQRFSFCGNGIKLIADVNTETQKLTRVTAY